MAIIFAFNSVSTPRWLFNDDGKKVSADTYRFHFPVDALEQTLKKRKHLCITNGRCIKSSVSLTAV